jgi:hypothetical protein
LAIPFCFGGDPSWLNYRRNAQADFSCGDVSTRERQFLPGSDSIVRQRIRVIYSAALFAAEHADTFERNLLTAAVDQLRGPIALADLMDARDVNRGVKNSYNCNVSY